MKINFSDRLPRILIEIFLRNLPLIYAVNYATNYAISLVAASKTFEAGSIESSLKMFYNVGNKENDGIITLTLNSCLQ